MTVGNATLPVAADTQDGVARFSWTPAARGVWTLHLVRDGSQIASSDVTVVT